MKSGAGRRTTISPGMRHRQDLRGGGVTLTIRFVVIDRADVLDRARREELTSLLLTSEIEQAIVLATSEEPIPSIVPESVKFFDLGHGTNLRSMLKLLLTTTS
ncbi:MAG TPA: hypothetical protein VGS27_05155 [Candidatus Sulfotelmatobacter sp.]|nr:hypothetical protein [Candidatus Sulfotelmatobacter sp.]